MHAPYNGYFIGYGKIVIHSVYSVMEVHAMILPDHIPKTRQLDWRQLTIITYISE